MKVATFALFALLWLVPVHLASADPLSCNLSGYRGAAGLTATAGANTLTVIWDGERNQELRMQFGLVSGVPTIHALDVRTKGAAAWKTLAANVTPDYRVVSGIRRISNQQLSPLRGLGVELTNEIVDRFRWEPFWDAPLDLSVPTGRGGNPPPAAGVANSPGLPRKPEEVKRGSLVANVTGCEVKTNGARVEVSFPGVKLGVFAGRLQYSIFRGSNLIQQDVLATTMDQWVAYKYDGGLRGLSSGNGTRVVWRDIANNWQENRLGGAINEQEMPLTTASRLVVAERGGAGSIAIFPPPHTFFWAREIAINLGYSWLKKDSATTFSLGVRQNEKEHESENQANFALYSARPGTVQQMTVFLYANAGSAEQTFDAALAYTHGDRFKPLAGYQVMNHHYHMDLGNRLGVAGSLNAEIPDLSALRALGINIVSQIDSVNGGGEPVPDGATFPGGVAVTAATREAARAAAAAAQPAAAPVTGGRGAGPGPAAAAPAGGGRGGRGDALQTRYNSIEGAKRHSDSNFLVMASQEYYGSPLGGHTDLLFSHPVYWTGGRAPGQPVVEPHPTYGKVYHIGSADDLMEMAKREDVLINMPHPRTKGSTGYPDSVKDLSFFSDPHYEGVGFRWGMGIDRSEVRLCEYRCQPLFDDMNNWIADKPIPPKHMMAISEVRHMQPGDEIYSSAPVQYVKLDRLPTGDDTSSVIQALMRGDSFVTSGEVLIPNYTLRGTGNQRTIVVDVEYTFPLNFVEVVWGDGVKSDRKIIATTELTPMGSHHFEIPFDATGKKWIRFAAWDSAGNGAMVQPIKLNATPQR
jgi:hypothetical protein